MAGEIKLKSGVVVTLGSFGKVTGKCKYCGADILWCVTKKGKRMPVAKDANGEYLCHLSECRGKKCGQ